MVELKAIQRDAEQSALAGEVHRQRDERRREEDAVLDDAQLPGLLGTEQPAVRRESIAVGSVWPPATRLSAKPDGSGRGGRSAQHHSPHHGLREHSTRCTHGGSPHSAGLAAKGRLSMGLGARRLRASMLRGRVLTSRSR